MERRLRWLTSALVVSAGAYAGVALATPGMGFTGTTISVGRFEEIDVRNSALPDQHWQAKLKTQGQSDLYVQSNVWAPGGTTGWHTHPGYSLITVTAGTITAYEGDDPDCTPTVYTVGMGFVDPGGHHAHVLRNEGAVEARTTASSWFRRARSAASTSPIPATARSSRSRCCVCRGARGGRPAPPGIFPSRLQNT